jgi:hypothetical protein
MAEIHTTVSGVVVHNPAQHPLPPSAGKPIAASAKPVGQPNAVVHGQISNSSVIVDNPA